MTRINNRILIYICIGILALLIIINVIMQRQINHAGFSFGPTPTPITSGISPTPVPKTAVLSLRQIAPNTIAVIVNAGGKPVSGVQVALSYDPQVLTNMQVTPGNFFDNPVILANHVDTSAGTIFFAFAIGPNALQKPGVGTVALLTFNVTSGVVNQTKLTFLPKTAVSIEGIDESVLKDASNFTLPVQ